MRNNIEKKHIRPGVLANGNAQVPEAVCIEPAAAVILAAFLKRLRLSVYTLQPIRAILYPAFVLLCVNYCDFEPGRPGCYRFGAFAPLQFAVQ